MGEIFQEKTESCRINYSYQKYLVYLFEIKNTTFAAMMRQGSQVSDLKETQISISSHLSEAEVLLSVTAL